MQSSFSYTITISISNDLEFYKVLVHVHAEAYLSICFHYYYYNYTYSLIEIRDPFNLEPAISSPVSNRAHWATVAVHVDLFLLIYCCLGLRCNCNFMHVCCMGVGKFTLVCCVTCAANCIAPCTMYNGCSVCCV